MNRDGKHATPVGTATLPGQTANLAINPALYPRMPFNPLKNFPPISGIASQPVVLVVNASSPLKTLGDIVSASKAKPASLRIGLAGNGTVGHLAGEMLERRAGFNMLNVAYKGAGPATNDLISGQVAMAQLNRFEEQALADPDVRYGFDNYEILKQLGELVREVRRESGMTQQELQDVSSIDQAEISRLESGSMERGPSLLTLVRIAHAAGKRLIIGVQDPNEGEGSEMKVLRF